MPPISYSPDICPFPGNSIDLGEITVNSDYPDTESTGEDTLNTDEPYLHTAHAGLAVLMYPQQNTLKFILDMRNISAIVAPIKTYLLLALETVLPIAGRVLGIAGILMPSSIAKEPLVIYYHDNSYGEGDPDIWKENMQSKFSRISTDILMLSTSIKSQNVILYGQRYKRTELSVIWQ